ncbi:MAG: hypothetical protein RL220_359, partial [Bacteroidota bacterium]
MREIKEMQNLENILSAYVRDAINSLYGQEIPTASVQIQKTRKEFQGDQTLVTFPLLKISGKKPEDTGADIGEYLKANCPIVADYNVVKGFLNIVLRDDFWASFFNQIAADPNYGS